MNKLFKHSFASVFFALASLGGLTACSTDNMLRPSPTATQAPVLLWANEAVVAAYTYNYATLTHDLQSASAYFTPEGWAAFNEALVNSGNLAAVTKKKLIVSALVEGTPTILNEQTVRGRSTWVVQIPLQVTLQNAKIHKHIHFQVTMHIFKVSAQGGTTGLAIEQFIATPANDPVDQ